jgi:uncharacterized BrkB/YihY/UPF0761 family membrane protein
VTVTILNELNVNVAGFVKALVKSAWAAVEVIEDNPTQMPRTWPVLPIDKSANKVRFLLCFQAILTLSLLLVTIIIAVRDRAS